MRPFLLMTLHFSQIGFTDDLTFTVITSFHMIDMYCYKPATNGVFTSICRKSIYEYNTQYRVLQALFNEFWLFFKKEIFRMRNGVFSVDFRFFLFYNVDK